MLKEDEIYKDDRKDVKLICPVCNTKKIVEVSKKLVEQSKTLLTISVPANYMCEHGFQAYVDKWFSVRGYQNADLELRELEIYETGSKKVDEVVTYAVSLVIKKTIKTLKEEEENGVILGGALFNQKGNLLHFSLPNEVFLKIVQQLELQKVDYKLKLNKMIFVMENNQKIFAEFLKVEDTVLNIVILFPADFSINDANSFFNDFKKTIMEYEDPAELMKKEQITMRKIEEAQKRRIEKHAPSNYWVYSKITSEIPLEKLDRIYIDNLDIKIDKKNILNLEEIIEISKDGTFEGKVYFSENFIRLMEGLALTMKDASILLSKLNKKP